MLNQYEVSNFITFRLPEVKLEISRTGAEPTAYQSIQVVADYAKRMALEHDFKMVKKCMNLVQKLYEKGNNLVRNAVENIFIFSFSSMLSNCSIVEWRIVQSYMPEDLYSLYVKQILKSKC
jgi:hypothetical protein